MTTLSYDGRIIVVEENVPKTPALLEAQRVLGELEKRLAGRDVVVKVCMEEILQFCCDLLSSVDARYTPENVAAVLVAVNGASCSQVDGWAQYTEKQAPTVVEHIRATGELPYSMPKGTN